MSSALAKIRSARQLAGLAGLPTDTDRFRCGTEALTKLRAHTRTQVLDDLCLDGEDVLVLRTWIDGALLEALEHMSVDEVLRQRSTAGGEPPHPPLMIDTVALSGITGTEFQIRYYPADVGLDPAAPGSDMLRAALYHYSQRILVLSDISCSATSAR